MIKKEQEKSEAMLAQAAKKGNFRNIIIKFTQPSHQGIDRHCFIPEIMENGKPGQQRNFKEK